jgi:hypothetical protein
MVSVRIWRKASLGELPARHAIHRLRHGPDEALGSRIRPCEYFSNLEFTVRYAKEEAGKIRRLAVSGIWANDYVPRNVMPVPPLGELYAAIERSWEGFPGVEKLFVYHEDIFSIHDTYVGKESEDMEREIMELVRRLKRREGGWNGQVPVVTVLRDLESKKDEDGNWSIPDETDVFHVPL